MSSSSVIIQSSRHGFCPYLYLEVKHILNATDHKSVFDIHTTCNYNNVYDKCVLNLNERQKLGITLNPKLRTYINV